MSVPTLTRNNRSAVAYTGSLAISGWSWYIISEGSTGNACFLCRRTDKDGTYNNQLKAERKGGGGDDCVNCDDGDCVDCDDGDDGNGNGDGDGDNQRR